MSDAGAAAAGLAAIRNVDAVWWVEPEVLAALRSGGWLDPRRIEATLAAARDENPRGRAPVAVVRVGDDSLVIREVRHGGVLRGVLRARLAAPDRPLDEISTTMRLRSAGAPVPRAGFAGAWRRGAVWRGVVATHLEIDTRDGESFLRSATASARLRAAANAGRAIRRFHDAGGWHPDLQIRNLLVRSAADPDVLVIDLDRARVLASVDPRARMAQLMRLYRSLRKRGLLDAVGPRGIAACFRAYLAGDRNLRRAMMKRLPAEQRRVARHALLYR